MRAVELIDNTEDPAVVPLMVTDAGLREQVIGSTAPVGAFVTAHDKLIAPVKPPLGVSVSVDVLPVVASRHHP